MRKLMHNIKTIHGPYMRKDGRSQVCVTYKDNSKRDVSYPKFLVELVLGRKLDPNEETIDHIDGNFYNNSWDNLRIVPRNKHAREDIPIVADVIIKCVWCGGLAKRRANQLNHNAKLGKAGPFCTSSCTGKYGQAVQSG